MKILHLGKYYPPFHGGMESYLKDLAEAQVRQGHEVIVMVHNHQWGWLKSKTEYSEMNGVKVIRLACSRPVLHTPLMLGLNQQIRRILKDESIDVLHLHTPNPSLLTLAWHRRARQVPWVISWHSDMVTEHSGVMMKCLYRILKPLENRLIRQASVLLVSSDNYANHSPQLKINHEKVKVIPLGINVASLKNQTKCSALVDSYWPADKLRIFHLGRLTRYKNQQLLIKAMRHYPSGHLLLAGSGALADVLKNLVSANGLEQRVTLTGGVSQDELDQLFAQCDVFCLASHDRAESFGVVLLEAMYHNKIILVADTPGSGMCWLANQYNKGFTFKSNDEDDLLAKLEGIHRDLSAIQALPPHFDYHIDDIASRIEDNYHSITLTGEQHEN